MRPGVINDVETELIGSTTVASSKGVDAIVSTVFVRSDVAQRADYGKILSLMEASDRNDEYVMETREREDNKWKMQNV